MTESNKNQIVYDKLMNDLHEGGLLVRFLTVIENVEEELKESNPNFFELSPPVFTKEKIKIKNFYESNIVYSTNKNFNPLKYNQKRNKLLSLFYRKCSKSWINGDSLECIKCDFFLYCERDRQDDYAMQEKKVIELGSNFSELSPFSVMVLAVFISEVRDIFNTYRGDEYSLDDTIHPVPEFISKSYYINVLKQYDKAHKALLKAESLMTPTRHFSDTKDKKELPILKAQIEAIAKNKRMISSLNKIISFIIKALDERDKKIQKENPENKILTCMKNAIAFTRKSFQWDENNQFIHNYFTVLYVEIFQNIDPDNYDSDNDNYLNKKIKNYMKEIVKMQK